MARKSSVKIYLRPLFWWVLAVIGLLMGWVLNDSILLIESTICGATAAILEQGNS